MILLIAIGVVIALVALDILALRFGAESRDGFTEATSRPR
jgi:hypothetical protein